MEQQARSGGSAREGWGPGMQDLISSVWSGYVRVDEGPVHPPHPYAGTTISPIHYMRQSARSALGLGVLLLRFGTSRYTELEL